jgi:CarD family transcriptional regulator
MGALLNFSCGDYVVYPNHGLGVVKAIEEQEISGCHLRVFVIEFQKNRMTVRVPVMKAASSGMRPLATTEEIQKAFDILKKKLKAKKTVWARRAQEYELKINSGHLISIAEVLRELYRQETDQSYSERQVYHTALTRMCSEIALVKACDENSVAQEIESYLKTG